MRNFINKYSFPIAEWMAVFSSIGILLYLLKLFANSCDDSNYKQLCGDGYAEISVVVSVAAGFILFFCVSYSACYCYQHL